MVRIRTWWYRSHTAWLHAVREWRHGKMFKNQSQKINLGQKKKKITNFGFRLLKTMLKHKIKSIHICVCKIAWAPNFAKPNPKITHINLHINCAKRIFATRLVQIYTSTAIVHFVFLFFFCVSQWCKKKVDAGCSVCEERRTI